MPALRRRGAVVLGALTLNALLALVAIAQTVPPLVVAHLVVAHSDRLDQFIVEARVEMPNGSLVRELFRVGEAECTEDVGGMESISVVRCVSESQWPRIEFEMLEMGRRVVVDEYRTASATAERRRVRRTVVARTRRGWAVVPRCAETFNDPRACPPPGAP